MITSNISSMPEVAGEAAILVDPHSIEAITAGMLAVVSDKKRVEQLVAKGREQKKEFSWDKSAETIYEALKR